MWSDRLYHRKRMQSIELSLISCPVYYVGWVSPWLRNTCCSNNHSIWVSAIDKLPNGLYITRIINLSVSLAKCESFILGHQDIGEARHGILLLWIFAKALPADQNSGQLLCIYCLASFGFGRLWFSFWWSHKLGQAWHRRSWLCPIQSPFSWLSVKQCTLKRPVLRGQSIYKSLVYISSIWYLRT